MESSRDGLLIDIERCTGCRLCQIACAMQHFGRPDPRHARVHIIRFQDPELNVPVICMACENAPCIKVCPVNARVREINNSVVTDEDRCIGCGACIYICPVGSPGRNPATGKTMTCDMCQGTGSEPWCVAACRDEKALTHCGSGGPAYTKNRRHARNILSGNISGNNPVECRNAKP